MEFKGKRALVLGAGISGDSAKEFLTARGASVVVYEDKIGGEVDGKFDLCVISPGISINHPLAQKYRDVLISELDLGFCEKHGKVIGVTGTNGKTTVVGMLHRVFRGSVLCGNVGVPVTAVDIRKKTAVVEVSSFQLEVPPKYFRPDVSIVLNVTQDHLERHGTMEEYTACKMRIRGAVSILNYDDAICRANGDANTLWFSTKERVNGAYLDGDTVTVNFGKLRKTFKLSDFGATLAEHDIANILAVVLAGCVMRVSRKRIVMGCRTAKSPHRIEYVATIGNAVFYNDSKATNVAATLAACRSFGDMPINLILGGVPKGQDFSVLFRDLPANVENIFAIGEAAPDIIECSNGRALKCETLNEAVDNAANVGVGARVVLLSPACASFDMFRNYAHRGDEFKRIVLDLK